MNYVSATGQQTIPIRRNVSINELREKLLSFVGAMIHNFNCGFSVK